MLYEGSKSSGTRKASKVNYGALHNQPGGYKTHDDSMIPNKTVPKREWFGIHESAAPGGEHWRKAQLEMHLRIKSAFKK